MLLACSPTSSTSRCNSCSTAMVHMPQVGSTNGDKVKAHLGVSTGQIVLLRASPAPASLQLVSDQPLVAVCIEGNGTHHQIETSLITSKEPHAKDLYNTDGSCYCSKPKHNI